MINKTDLIKVRNKYNGLVGYDVPELSVHRDFYAGQTKEVTFDEIEKLSFAPGGEYILKEYLEIQNEEAVQQLFNIQSEPEYHYSREDIKNLMVEGTLDQFLDCLDFAPQSIKEIIKDMAVELPLNDVEKRKAILDNLGFDVTRAIEIKNTKYDGDKEQDGAKNAGTSTRRAAPINKEAPAPTGRRYVPSEKK